MILLLAVMAGAASVALVVVKLIDRLSVQTAWVCSQPGCRCRGQLSSRDHADGLRVR